MRASPRCTRSSTACMAPCAPAVSRSSLASGASGNRRASVSSTRSVPWPTGLSGWAQLAARHRHLRLCAAMMAAQLSRAPMQGHARIAMGALCGPPTGAAEQARRISAPIQEHDHLSAIPEMLPDGLHRRLRQAVLDGVLAQVDEHHPRRTCGARPLRQRQPRVAALRDIFQRLERRCGRTQDDGDLCALRAPDGQIARRVAEALVLLVGGIVFLIDHDEA